MTATFLVTVLRPVQAGLEASTIHNANTQDLYCIPKEHLAGFDFSVLFGWLSLMPNTFFSLVNSMASALH